MKWAIKWWLRRRLFHSADTELDGRAMDLLQAGQTVIPRLNDLVGPDAAQVENELVDAIKLAAETGSSWDAEVVRDVLFRYPDARTYLETLVPAARKPRPFRGDFGLSDIYPG